MCAITRAFKLACLLVSALHALLGTPREAAGGPLRGKSYDGRQAAFVSAPPLCRVGRSRMHLLPGLFG